MAKWHSPSRAPTNRESEWSKRRERVSLLCLASGRVSGERKCLARPAAATEGASGSLSEQLTHTLSLNLAVACSQCTQRQCTSLSSAVTHSLRSPPHARRAKVVRKEKNPCDMLVFEGQEERHADTSILLMQICRRMLLQQHTHARSCSCIMEESFLTCSPCIFRPQRTCSQVHATHIYIAYHASTSTLSLSLSLSRSLLLLE